VVTKRLDWAGVGACKGTGPEVAVCRGCPLRRPCTDRGPVRADAWPELAADWLDRAAPTWRRDLKARRRRSAA
jgi:hypothetical protein